MPESRASASSAKEALELPGFFRPTKEWDLVVVKDGTLIAAIEAKSQVGPSFGNNFNNRTEEAMGSALDLWTAYREGAYLDSPQPFLGYFFMLEDCAASSHPVSVKEPHFKVFPEFVGVLLRAPLRAFLPQARPGAALHRRRLSSLRKRPTGESGDYVTPAEDLSMERFAKSSSGASGCGHIDCYGWNHTQTDQRRCPGLVLSPGGESCILLSLPRPTGISSATTRTTTNSGTSTTTRRFLDELEKVWRHVFRVLVPGGRLVCVVGDVCVSRREFGRHLVFPLHADIVVRCRKMGFDNLNPIIWHKIANASYEVSNGSKFLGKPYEPNAIIKNDIEFILMQRKPGGYRQPTNGQREESKIDKKDFDEWFQQIWNIPGASTRNHPAPVSPGACHASGSHVLLYRRHGSRSRSAAPARRWSPPSRTDATASAWRSTGSTAGWPPGGSRQRTPACLPPANSSSRRPRASLHADPVCGSRIVPSPRDSPADGLRTRVRIYGSPSARPSALPPASSLQPTVYRPSCSCLVTSHLSLVTFCLASFASLRDNCPQRSNLMDLRRSGWRFLYAGRTW